MRRTALVLLLTAAATPAWAQVDNTPLACTDGPTYFPRGDHWAVLPNGAQPVPILYLQATAGSDDIPSSTAEQDAVQRAFLTWMSVMCSGLYPNIFIGDGGDYSGADFGTEYDSVIRFAESADQSQPGAWAWDSQTVAMTTVLHYEDTLETVGADMVFNGINFRWRARPGAPSPTGAYQGCSAAASCYDVESVALHEAGHFMGFQHVTCVDAVMFPHGSGTDARTVLSEHEAAGICALYPPRPTNLSTTRAFSESCTQASECPGPGSVCLKSLGTSGSGYCTRSCASNSDCPTAYACSLPEGHSSRVCMPGPNDTGGGIGSGGTATPGSDLCAPCTEGSQCSNGMCVSDGAGTSICTQPCTTALGCPSGFDCLQVGSGTTYACWPQASGCQSSANYTQLNDLCFAEDPNNPTNPYYAPCSPELICFGFKPRCEGQEGACVNYCNPSTRCAEGLTCCYGVTAAGTCIQNPTQEGQHGGCFNIRRTGESCYLAESSICESGSECFSTDGNPTSSRCFANCDSGICAAGTTCLSGEDGCANIFNICCDTEIWDGQGRCQPAEPEALYELGVRCGSSAECDSGLCLRYDGESACSRVCNPVTGVGCPGQDFDANDDGTPDGGFICRLIGGAVDPGRCWPRNGPVDPPVRTADDAPEPPGGCCNAAGLGPGDFVVGGVVWGPLVWGWVRRRRRGRVS